MIGPLQMMRGQGSFNRNFVADSLSPSSFPSSSSTSSTGPTNRTSTKRRSEIGNEEDQPLTYRQYKPSQFPSLVKESPLFGELAVAGKTAELDRLKKAVVVSDDEEDDEVEIGDRYDDSDELDDGSDGREDDGDDDDDVSERGFGRDRSRRRRQHVSKQESLHVRLAEIKKIEAKTDLKLRRIRHRTLTTGAVERMVRQAVLNLNERKPLQYGPGTDGDGDPEDIVDVTDTGKSLSHADAPLFPELVSATEAIGSSRPALEAMTHPSASSSLWPPFSSISRLARGNNIGDNQATSTPSSSSSFSSSLIDPETGVLSDAFASPLRPQSNEQPDRSDSSKIFGVPQSMLQRAPLSVSNRLAVDTNAKLFVITPPSASSPAPSIKSVDLRTLSRQGPLAPTKEYVCAMAGDVAVGLPSTVDSIVLNSATSYAALSSVSSVIVVKLPEPGLEEDVANRADRIVCPALTVGTEWLETGMVVNDSGVGLPDNTHPTPGTARQRSSSLSTDGLVDNGSFSSLPSSSSSPSSPTSSANPNRVLIRQVQWHPLSTTHLVVLYSNSILAMYNVAVDCGRPEQVFHLGRLRQSASSRPGSAATSRAGSPSRLGSRAGSREDNASRQSSYSTVAPSISRAPSANTRIRNISLSAVSL